MNNEKIKRVEITKKVLLERVANSMTSYRRYGVYFKAYTDDKGGYYRFNDVVLVYDEDVCEYADKDYVGEKQSKAIISEFVFFDIDGQYVGLTIDKARELQREHIDSYNKSIF